MTQRDIDTEILATYRGRIMRKLDTAGFKIVVCLGATREGDKLRVCVWSDNQRKWSNVQTRKVSELGELRLDEMTARHRATVGHAVNQIEKNSGSGNEGGVVKYGNGAVYVGKPWLNKASPKGPSEGVTKLAPVTFSAANKRQVQQLNKLLGNILTPGKR